MAFVAAGGDEEAFEWYPTAMEVRISQLRTGHVCPQGSKAGSTALDSSSR